MKTNIVGIIIALILTFVGMLSVYAQDTKVSEVRKVDAFSSIEITSVGTIYFRFLSVRLNRLKNKLLANYLRNRGNDLATVRNSAFCVAILSNNSFICKYNIFFRKYELSVAIL